MKNKKYWVIPLIIGIVLIVVGIILFATMPAELPMEDAGWFDNSTARSGHIVGGIFTLFVGVMAIVSGFVINQIENSKTAELSNKLIDKIGDAIDNIGEEKQPKVNYCSYCGSKLNEDGSCSSCGAKSSAKKNK